jgi:two-component system sensor kinase FixL
MGGLRDKAVTAVPDIKPRRDFDALLDAAVDGIILSDHTGSIEVFNHAAERLFGYAAAEITGRNIKELMNAEDARAHDGHIARFVATRVPHIIGKGREVTARRKDGTVFPAFLSVGLVSGSDPPRFFGFIQDVSSQRQSEDEARRLQERLWHVSRLATMGEMASGIAHELNQPLAAIANYAQACDRLLSKPDADIPEVREALKEITGQAVRAGDIIRRLRGLASRASGHSRATDVNALISELTDLVKWDLRAHEVQYRLDAAPALPSVDVHPEQLQQVVLNLIRNAIESLAHSVQRDRDITVRTTLTDQKDVEIAVCDNGPGVPSDMVSRLFDPFYTSKATGTGLGLAMSRTIIGQHHGTLTYRANVPSGACFVVRLPQHSESEA